MKETQDSISVVFRPMADTEAKAFCGDHFSKELLPAYIEVQNGSSLTIRYAGDGLLNNDIDNLFKKPFSKQSIQIEAVTGVLPIILGYSQSKVTTVMSVLPVAVNTGCLIYNEVIEDKQAEFYKTYNFNSILNRVLLPGEKKQLLLYFEKGKAASAKFAFVKHGATKHIDFKTRVGDAQPKSVGKL
jgi:hypothetical protein